MKTLLITGIESVVGSNLAAALADRVQVIGTSRSPNLRLDGVTSVECDLADPQAIDALVQQYVPDIIIHCGPLSQASWELADRVVPATEADEVANLARAAAKLHATSAAGCHLTVISTAAIFAGPTLFHHESDKSEARSDWAVLAAKIEQSLPRDSSLVVRTDAYGWSPAGTTPSYAETLYDAIENEVPIRADGLRHATPILATDLAEHLWEAISRRLTGVLHLCGAERASPYQFACELARVMERPIALPSSEETFEPDAAGETSLNSQRARRELSAWMPLLQDGLARFCDQVASGHRDRIAAMTGAPVPAPHFSMSGVTMSSGSNAVRARSEH